MRSEPRDRILRATRALLREQSSPRPVPVDEIASAAHVSRATIYRYFGGKDALIQAARAGEPNGALPTDPRERILEAALEVFGERGLHAATLAEIASRAGLTLSGLHWHFRNKDELVAGIAASIPFMTTVASEASRAADDDADLRTQLAAVTSVALRELQRRRAVLRLIVFEAGIHPDVARLARQHTLGRFLPLLTTIFERHAERGTIRPGSARARAQALLGMMMVLALLRPTFGDLLEPDDTATIREYVEIMVRGIEVAAPPGGDR